MPETEKQTAIEAQNVVRKFGGQYAVNSVSFEVKQGEFVSLLGPSGCGKQRCCACSEGSIGPTKAPSCSPAGM